MNIRSALGVLACAIAFGAGAVSGVPNAAVASAEPLPAHADDPYDSDFDDSDDEAEPPTDDNGDGPLQRFICRLGIGHWTHPLADAVTVYVWAEDYADADRKARDDHPTTPPFEYIAWSRCDPA
jgi:hypothetical protein